MGDGLVLNGPQIRWYVCEKARPETMKDPMLGAVGMLSRHTYSKKQKRSLWPSVFRGIDMPIAIKEQDTHPFRFDTKATECLICRSEVSDQWHYLNRNAIKIIEMKMG